MTARTVREKGGLRIHQALAHDLGTDILTGKYQPGDAFVGEVESSEQLKVSRSAYREAIRILIAKGLLESRPKAGTHVTPRKQWNMLDPDVLGWMFAGEPEDSFTHDLFELRGVIEPAACAFAAERRTEAHLREMAESVADMGRYGLAAAEGQAADQRFHETILDAANNVVLRSLASSVTAAVRWTTRFKQRRRMLPRDPTPDHRAVYDAIAARDPDLARRAMDALLRLALEDMQPAAQVG